MYNDIIINRIERIIKTKCDGKVAKFAGSLGVNRSTVYKILSGRHSPRPELIDKISQVYGVEVVR